jgi:glycerol-3-phosphate dehydrogenase subunit C
VQKVKNAFFDPFEYLMLRHKEGKLKTDFKAGPGQGGLPRRLPPARAEHRPEDPGSLSLVPGTEVDIIERCSGHDGTYAVKKEFHAFAMKIVKPVVTRVNRRRPDHYGSDCAMAGHHIAHARADGSSPRNIPSPCCARPTGDFTEPWPN